MKSENRQIWNYISISWILLWLSGSIALFFKFKPEMVASIGLALIPFILCGFFIPFFIIYEKSDLSFPNILNWIFKVRPGKSSKIHYLCIVIIPTTILILLYLLIYPESYLKYGPQYTKQFAYYLAFIQFLYLIAYVGYWKEQKWGIYLYIAASVFSILVRNYSFGISISAKDTAWHVFVIVYGFIYISNNIENKL